MLVHRIAEDILLVQAVHENRPVWTVSGDGLLNPLHNIIRTGADGKVMTSAPAMAVAMHSVSPTLGPQHMAVFHSGGYLL